MFLLGLIAAICFVPGITGASIPTQWPFLSVSLLPSLWLHGPFTWAHKLGIFFLAYAGLTTLWAHNYNTSVIGVWYLSVWALAFWLGTTQSTLRPLWHGLAWGVALSSLVAILQWFGFHPVEVYPDQIAGLYFNSTMLGAATALMLVACLCHRLWYPAPLLIIGLALSHSRGAILILVIGLAARIHWLLVLIGTITSLALISHLSGPSDLQRLEIWGEAIRNMTLWGWGPNSFDDLYAVLPRRPTMTPSLYHLGFTHNDYLQLLFEFGAAGALAAYAIIAAALGRVSKTDFPLFAAWSALAMFYFPLYAPLLALIGCACAGHLLRPDDAVRPVRKRRRSNILSWVDYTRSTVVE